MFHRVILGVNVKEVAVKVISVDDADAADFSGV